MQSLYPTLVTWMADVRAWAAQVGYVSTILGRKRQLPNINSTNNWDRASDERKAVNTIIQGSAADMMKLALISVGKNERFREIGGLLRLQVHDEIIATVPTKHIEEGAQLITHIMENPFELLGTTFPLPLEVDCKIVERWADAK